VRAQTWNGTTSGNWSTNTNWVGNTTPTFGTSADITFGSSNTNTSPSFLGAARIIRSLNFNDLADGNVTIRLTTNATGTSTAGLSFSAASGSANLTVASGADGNFTIGNSTGSVTLTSNLTVDHNGNGTLTIDRPISGSNRGITKNGTGTLILSGVNTFTGGVRINNGTVTGTVAASMSTAANIVTFGGAGAGGGERRGPNDCDRHGNG
jgi:autotransporter-associated beta strand protein